MYRYGAEEGAVWLDSPLPNPGLSLRPLFSSADLLLHAGFTSNPWHLPTLLRKSGVEEGAISVGAGHALHERKPSRSLNAAPSAYR